MQQLQVEVSMSQQGTQVAKHCKVAVSTLQLAVVQTVVTCP